MNASHALPTRPISQRHELRWQLAGLGLFLLLYILWLGRGGEVSLPRPWVGSLSTTFSALLAAWCCWQVGQRTETLPRLWNGMAFGQLFWALFSLLHLLTPAHSALSGLSFGLALAGSLAWLAGLLAEHPWQVARPIRLINILDMAIGMIALTVLLGQTLLPNTLPLAPLRFALADLLPCLLFLGFFLLQRQRSAWPFLAAGLGFLLASLSSSRLALGSYQAGGPGDLGWMLRDLLISSAALIAQQRSPLLRLEIILTRLQRLLPMIATLLLSWYAVFSWQMHLATASFDLLLSFGLLLVLIARQGVALGEVEMAQYAGLVNSIADPIFVCDDRGRIRLANRALLQVTGCSETSILGQPVQTLFAAGPGGVLNETVLRRALYGNGWDGELALRHANGTLLPVWLSLRPISDAPRPGTLRRERLALAGSAHDLSDPKSQQAALEMAYEQLEQAHAELERLNAGLEEKVSEKTLSLSAAYQQLEAQNRTLQQLDALKSDFISLVSHELRAPLTNIAGGIELVLHQARRLPQPTTETLTLVQAEIERLTRFVETILDLSALDAGRMPLYPAPLALSDLLPQWQRQIRHLPDRQRVQWQIPTNLPLVLADDQALSSILFHLLDNAFKYAPEGNITVRAAEQGDWIILAVQDEGAGIAPDSMELLFQQFYRRNRDNQTVYGHGLGLYIVRRLLEAMNGRIEAANAPQGGAVFTCWLPRYVEDSSPEVSFDDHLNH